MAAAVAAAAGDSDRCGEGRVKGGGAAAEAQVTASGRVRGWGEAAGAAPPLPELRHRGTPLRSPPRCRCPPVSETEPLAGRSRRGHGGE